MVAVPAVWVALGLAVASSQLSFQQQHPSQQQHEQQQQPQQLKACVVGPRLWHGAVLEAELGWCDKQGCATKRHPLWSKRPPTKDTLVAPSLAPKGLTGGSRFAGFLAALREGDPTEIVSYGGSMMRGNGCLDPIPQWGNDCAYSARFAKYLRMAYKGARLEATNRAMAAATTPSMLPLLGFMSKGVNSTSGVQGMLQEHVMSPSSKSSWAEDLTPQLVLIDFSTNDAWIDAKSSVASTEALVRHLLKNHPRAVPCLVETFPGEPDAKKRQRRIEVFGHYGLPVLRYHTLVKASVPEDLAEGDRSWQHDHNIAGQRGAFLAHPSWHTHQLIADALAVAFESWSTYEYQAAAGGEVTPGPPLCSQALLQLAPICEGPLAAFGHIPNGDGTASWLWDIAPRSSSGDWTFVAEGNGTKPGFISHDSGSTLIFENLRFSGSPVLQIVYLRGYDMNGTVLVNVSDQPEAYFRRRDKSNHNLLRASDDGHVTQRAVWTDVPFISKPDSDRLRINLRDHLVNHTSLNDSFATLTVTLTHQAAGKFKLISLTTC